MTVDTKTAPHRTLEFSDWSGLIDEIDRCASAARDGRLVTTGNWTPGQIAEHCAKFMRGALDGFPFRAPGVVRFVFRTLHFKRAMGPGPIPAGFKLPEQASDLLPSDTIEIQAGFDMLRAQAKRVLDGERFSHPSPLFGKMTHQQWEIIQMKHVSLHFGFMRIDGGE